MSLVGGTINKHRTIGDSRWIYRLKVDVWFLTHLLEASLFAQGQICKQKSHTDIAIQYFYPWFECKSPQECSLNLFSSSVKPLGSTLYAFHFCPFTPSDSFFVFLDEALCRSVVLTPVVGYNYSAHCVYCITLITTTSGCECVICCLLLFQFLSEWWEGSIQMPLCTHKDVTRKWDVSLRSKSNCASKYNVGHNKKNPSFSHTFFAWNSWQAL